MAKENLMNSAHKTSSDAYREGWERIFGNKQPPHTYPWLCRTCVTCKYVLESLTKVPCCGCESISKYHFSNWEAR